MQAQTFILNLMAICLVEVAKSSADHSHSIKDPIKL